MADHQNRRAAVKQRAQNLRKGAAKGRVHTLGRLVQQQNVRVQQQNFRQRRALLFAARQVIWVPLHQILQSAKRRHACHLLCALCARKARAVQNLQQVLPYRAFHEQRLHLLGQQRRAAMERTFAPPGAVQSRQDRQRRALARAVAAQQRQKLAAPQGKIQPLHRVGPVFFIAEPDLFGAQDLFAHGRDLLRRKRMQRMLPRTLLQIAPSLAHGHGAVPCSLHRSPDAHGLRHGAEKVAALPQRASQRRGRAAVQNTPALQHRRARSQRQRFVQPVLRQDHRGAQFPVDAPQRRQKIRRRNGIEAAGWLVQQQHLRLHRHHGSQIQQLLLPAGEFAHAPVKPVLDPEKRRHFRHAPPDHRRFIAQALQAEGQLVPHLVRDQLVFRILLHKADLLRAAAPVQIIQRAAPEPNVARSSSVGRQFRLQQAQQCGFSAAGRAAKHQKLPLLHRERYTAQRLPRLLRIGKTHIAECKRFHCLSSLPFRYSGVQHSAP